MSQKPELLRLWRAGTNIFSLKISHLPRDISCLKTLYFISVNSGQSLRKKIWSLEDQVLKIDPVNKKSITYKCVSQKSIKWTRSFEKNDQLLFLYIAVDRFLKRTLSLDWFWNTLFHLIGFSLEGSTSNSMYTTLTFMPKTCLRVP